MTRSCGRPDVGHDRVLTGEDDEEVVALVSVTEEQLARCGRPARALVGEGRERVVAQARIRALVVAGLLEFGSGAQRDEGYAGAPRALRPPPVRRLRLRAAEPAARR